MNVENKKVFIAGLLDWINGIENKIEKLKFESKSCKITGEYKIYLKNRIEKLQELKLNISIEKEKQEQESKHYIGV